MNDRKTGLGSAITVAGQSRNLTGVPPFILCLYHNCGAGKHQEAFSGFPSVAGESLLSDSAELLDPPEHVLSGASTFDKIQLSVEGPTAGSPGIVVSGKSH